MTLQGLISKAREMLGTGVNGRLLHVRWGGMVFLVHGPHHLNLAESTAALDTDTKNIGQVRAMTILAGAFAQLTAGYT